MRALPRRLHAVVILAGFLLPSAGLRAYEVDNFTDRDTLTQDSLPILDHKINQLIGRAIKLANKEAKASGDRCNRMLLRQELVRWVGPDPVSFLEFWATFTDDVQHTRVGFDKSIYSGASLTESPGMWVAGIGRSLNIAGHIVGTDKLGHFFMQGLDYYKRVSRDGADLDSVMRDEHGEDGVWGLAMTGVKSYADMAANYQGFRFWSQLYSGPAPYVRCENRRWVKAREFTWKDYVSDAWDEAINCSEMKPTLLAKARANMGKLGLSCPARPRACIEISRMERSAHFLSPACREVVAQAEARQRELAARQPSSAVTVPARTSAHSDILGSNGSTPEIR